MTLHEAYENLLAVKHVAEPMNAVAGGGGFINPYLFIPTPNRDKMPDGLGDGPPPTHGKYEDERWNGTIELEIETLTPLLLPDQGNASEPDGNSPRTAPMRKDPNGNALLLGSTIKGFLRANVEAITNSRFPRLNDRYNEPLGVRRGGSNAVTKMAVVESVAPDGIQIREGLSLRHNDHAQVTPIQPVSVERNRAHSIPADQRDMADVYAWIHLIHHHGLVQHPERNNYYFWAASDVWSQEKGANHIAEAYAREPRLHPANHNRAAWERVAVRPILVRGRLHWPGGDHQGKSDERLVVLKVISGPATQISLGQTTTLPATARETWKAMLTSYGAAHVHDSPAQLAKRGGHIRNQDSWDLKPGRTVYVEREGDKFVAFHPVAIGRDVFPNAPNTLIHKSLRPAVKLDEFSPADRMFGWGAPSKGDGVRGETGHRGHVRVDAVEISRTDGKPVITPFEPPLRLAILNGPKATQGRFYLRDESGLPLDEEPNRANTMYQSTQKLAGRKVYVADPLLRRAAAAGYWTPGDEITSENGVQFDGQVRFREYLPHAMDAVGVATAIEGWIAEGTKIRVKISIDNIAAIELGALLWLTTLPETAALRMGFGKPLGFGAVRLRVSNSSLAMGAALREGRYGSPGGKCESATNAELAEVIEGFRYATRGGAMRAVRDALTAVALGWAGAPVHYPRRKTEPAADNYTWWGVSESGEWRGGVRHEGSKEAIPAASLNIVPALPLQTAP